MSDHDLKTWPKFFWAVVRGEKTFEVRRNDRDFAVGDRIKLREWLPGEGGRGTYTGATIDVVVSYVLPGGQWGINEGFCVLGLRLPQGQDLHES